MSDQIDQRYARLARVGKVGIEGVFKLNQSRVLIVGLGALGAAAADCLARSGVGSLRIVDRDILELTNLQRQVLYSETDMADQLPKAIAAKRRLEQVNSTISVDAHVTDVTPANIEELCRDIDVIVDGTDNFETRLLINDVAHKLGIEWIYCGVIGAGIHTMPVLPGRGPCFRCFVPEAPAPGTVETCDTAGILGTTVLLATSLAMTETMKLCMGKQDEVVQGLQIVDLWNRDFRLLKVKKDPDCRACNGHYDYLSGEQTGFVGRLCGRDSVQLAPTSHSLNLAQLKDRLEPLGSVTSNPFLLKFVPATGDCHELTVFGDGRTIVKGTQDIGQARSIVARYIGS